MREWKGIAMVFGAVLVHLSLGTVYTFGNMAPYLASYYRNVLGQKLALSDLTWVYSAMIGCMGLCMSVGGLLERRLGTRPTAILGCSIMCTGIFVSYVTVNYNYWWVVVTYGMMYGGGISLPYIALLSCGMRWFPEKRGLVSGIIVAGFGMGTLIFNIVQTKFLNPDNLLPNKDGFFYEESLLLQVPNVFLLLGGIYAGMQVVGCLLANSPPPVPVITAEKKDDPVLAKLTINKNENNPSLTEKDNCCLELNIEKVEITVPKNYTPKELLKTREFYLMWLTFFFNANTANFVSSMYKIYGQTFIEDDLFLALVGSIGAAFNAFGRVGWGFMVDRFSYRACLRMNLTAVLILVLTMPATQLLGKYPFALWMFAIQLMISASYVLFPAFTSKFFGAQYAGTNYGMVFSQMVIGGPMTGILTSNLIGVMGFTGLFYLMGAFTVISIALTFPFREELYIPKKPKPEAKNIRKE